MITQSLVYMYVCKICEENFTAIGGHFLGYINPTWSSGIRTVSVNVNSSESTGDCFSSGQFKG